MITIDVDARRIDVEDVDIEARMRDVVAPEPRFTSGVMAKYAALVHSASEGAVTSRPPRRDATPD